MANNKNTKPAGKGMAIAAMVCGIVSIVFFWCGFISIPCGIVALILGIIALVKKKDGKGMAIAGVVTGAVGFLVTILVIILSFAAIDFVFNQAGDVLESETIQDTFSELEDWADKMNACLDEKGLTDKEYDSMTKEEQSAYVECL